MTGHCLQQPRMGHVIALSVSDYSKWLVCKQTETRADLRGAGFTGGTHVQGISKKDFVWKQPRPSF